MSDNTHVPIQIIKMGLTDEYVELKRKEEDCGNRLWKLCESQEELVGDTLKELDKLRHRFVKYTYEYDNFKERKEWRQSLIVQGMTNQIVELQGTIQELMTEQVDISEKLKNMSENMFEGGRYIE